MQVAARPAELAGVLRRVAAMAKIGAAAFTGALNGAFAGWNRVPQHARVLDQFDDGLVVAVAVCIGYAVHYFNEKNYAATSILSVLAIGLFIPIVTFILNAFNKKK